MQQIITAKLKLTTTPEQFAALRQTQQAYRDALNGRISLPYQGYDKHTALIREGATIGDAKLWYDRQKKTFYSQWSFAELQSLISYKSALAGSLAIKVDADYTAKACPMCGHTEDANRPQKGLRFVYQNPKCGYTLHADLIGAKNVTLRTLLIRQDWIRTGTLSMYPDASGREAKAARLQRYAELRWSPEVTSLQLLAGGAN